jgi:hypothetical protein
MDPTDSHQNSHKRIEGLMYTFMAMVALTTSFSTATLSPTPTWLTDYGTAQQRVTAASKPMAVFVGSGQEGWGKVLKDGALDAALKRLLADKFVCLYVDTDTSTGRALASSFEVPTRGLIISDRKGTSQAYSLSGALTKAELAQTLEKYADTGRTLQATETVVRDAPATIVRPVSVSYPTTVSYPTYAPQYRVVPSYYTSGST